VAQLTQGKTTLQDFLASPQVNGRYEWVDGEVIAKVAPKRFHSKTQRVVLRLLEDWGDDRGEVGVEWAVKLSRQGQSWLPVPDVSFVYADRLPTNLGDEPCPVPVDLAVEIISPDQLFGAMAEKAADYILAGVARVWVIDPGAQTITVFQAEALPVTYRGNKALTDDYFPELVVTAEQVFRQAGVLA
jgi:Uma2 family endonuclease